MSGSAGIRNEAFAAWDGVGRTSVFWAVPPLFSPRTPLAKLYTDVLAQESKRYRESRPPQGVGEPSAGRSGPHRKLHGSVRTGKTLLEQTDYTTLHYTTL